MLTTWSQNWMVPPLPPGGLSISGAARVGETITVTNTTGLSCFIQSTFGQVETYYEPWKDLDLIQPEPGFVIPEDWLGLKLRVRVPLLDPVTELPTGTSIVSNEIGPILHAVDPATEAGAEVVSTPAQLASAVSNPATSIIVLATNSEWEAADFPATIDSKRITTPQNSPAVIKNTLLRPTAWTNITWEGMVHYNQASWLETSSANRDWCFEPNQSGGTCDNILVIAAKVLTDNIDETTVKAVPPTLLQSPYRNNGLAPNPLGPAYEANGTNGMRFVIEGFNLRLVPNVEVRGYWGRNMARVLMTRLTHKVRNVRAHFFYQDGLLLQGGSGSAVGGADGLALSGWLSIYDEADAKTNATGSGNGPHTDGTQFQGFGTSGGYTHDRYVTVPGNTRAWADGMGSGGGPGVMPALITSIPYPKPRIRRALLNTVGSIGLYMAQEDYQLDYVTHIPFGTTGGGAARFNGFNNLVPENLYRGEGRVSRSLISGNVFSQDTSSAFYQRIKQSNVNFGASVATYVKGTLSYRANDLADVALLSRPQPGYEDRGALTASGHWRPLGAFPSVPAISSIAPAPGGFDATITPVAGATAYRLRWRATGNVNGAWQVPSVAEETSSNVFAIRGQGSSPVELEVQAWVETVDGVSVWSGSSIVTTQAAIVPDFPAGGDVANITTATYASPGSNQLDWQVFTSLSVPAHSVIAVAVGRDGTANTTVIGSDTDWTQVATGGVSGARVTVFYFHNATGSPVNKSLQVAFGGSEQGTAISAIFPVTPGATIYAGGAGAGSGSASTAHNPPSFDAGAVRKHLWLVAAAGDTNVSYTSAPGSFTSSPTVASSAFTGLVSAPGATTSSASTGMAFNFIETQTVDPTSLIANNGVSWATVNCAFAEL